MKRKNKLLIAIKFFFKSTLLEMIGNSKTSVSGMIALMLLVVGFISIPIAILVGELYTPFAMIHQEGVVLSIIVMIGGIGTLIMGIYTILNTFFFSNDTEYILPLPFTSYEIVAGKFVAVIMNLYIYSALMILPLIVFGNMSNAGPGYYILAIFLIAISPILPIIIDTLICMILMRFTKISKYKEMMRTIIGVLGLVFVVVFNVVLNSDNVSADDMFNALSKGNNGLMDIMGGALFTNNLAAKALMNWNNNDGLVYMVIAILITVALLIGYYIIGGSLYLKTIIGSTETFSKRENVVDSRKAIVKSSSVMYSLVKRDLRVIFRTSTFFINCIAMQFYMPGILIAAYFSGGGMEWIKLYATNSDNLPYILVGIFGLVLFLSAADYTSSSAISREGKDIELSKIIPIPYREQIRAKIISSIGIQSISFIFISILIIYLDLGIEGTILGLLISLFTIIWGALRSIKEDYTNPNIQWENEKEVFRGGTRIFIRMLIHFGFAASAVLLTSIAQNIYVISVALIVILIGLSLYNYRDLVGNADRYYNNLLN